VATVDALYINFISGFEIGLETALQLRLGYHGPMYADLHSLLLSMDAAGLRTLRPLVAWRDWLRCFDVVQLNETELETLAQPWGDPWRFASEVVNDELKLLLVTLADRGAAYIASSGFQPDPRTWRPRGLVQPPLRVANGAQSRLVAAPMLPQVGDPTGCGDVWGATCFCMMLSGASLEEAMMEANRAAARNVQHRGATGLNDFLQGRLTS
jgi:sugar/nucleoside kinase (ribokinase family)